MSKSKKVKGGIKEKSVPMKKDNLPKEDKFPKAGGKPMQGKPLKGQTTKDKLNK
jgi:hypothetical protein